MLISTVQLHVPATGSIMHAAAPASCCAACRKPSLFQRQVQGTPGLAIHISDGVFCAAHARRSGPASSSCR
jgi:hypothetical protein